MNNINLLQCSDVVENLSWYYDGLFQTNPLPSTSCWDCVFVASLMCSVGELLDVKGHPNTSQDAYLPLKVLDGPCCSALERPATSATGLYEISGLISSFNFCVIIITDWRTSSPFYGGFWNKWEKHQVFSVEDPWYTFLPCCRDICLLDYPYFGDVLLTRLHCRTCVWEGLISLKDG